MSDIITLTGIVASVPRCVTTTEGLAITSFRLASSQRRFDRTQQKWIDADTNWYTITAFRQLATNCAASIHRTDRVVVTGKLRIKEWNAGEKSGTNIEVDAEAIGHDLAWGTAAFSRNAVSARTDLPAEGSTQSVSQTDAAGFPSQADDDARSEHEREGDRALVLVDAVAGQVETPF